MTAPGRWLVFAHEDLALAELALQNGIVNQACFHAQQGVEKALKAFLRRHQRSVPKTHALSELLTLCQHRDRGFRRLSDACMTLDRYYIPTRYPDALPGMGSEGLPTRHDAEEAVTLVREALEWIEKKCA